MTHPVLVRRRRERQERLEVAASFAAGLDDSLGVGAVVVFGSVARGDFNLWSDIDVLVVADHLPERWLDRLGQLADLAPPGVSALAWTPAELAAKVAQRDPIATEVLHRGVVVAGSLPADLSRAEAHGGD